MYRNDKEFKKEYTKVEIISFLCFLVFCVVILGGAFLLKSNNSDKSDNTETQIEVNEVVNNENLHCEFLDKLVSIDYFKDRITPEYSLESIINREGKYIVRESYQVTNYSHYEDEVKGLYAAVTFTDNNTMPYYVSMSWLVDENGEAEQKMHTDILNIIAEEYGIENIEVSQDGVNKEYTVKGSDGEDIILNISSNLTENTNGGYYVSYHIENRTYITDDFNVTDESITDIYSGGIKDVTKNNDFSVNTKNHLDRLNEIIGNKFNFEVQTIRIKRSDNEINKIVTFIDNETFDKLSFEMIQNKIDGEKIEGDTKYKLVYSNNTGIENGLEIATQIASEYFDYNESIDLQVVDENISIFYGDKVTVVVGQRGIGVYSAGYSSDLYTDVNYFSN